MVRVARGLCTLRAACIVQCDYNLLSLGRREEIFNPADAPTTDFILLLPARRRATHPSASVQLFLNQIPHARQTASAARPPSSRRSIVLGGSSLSLASRGFGPTAKWRYVAK